MPQKTYSHEHHLFIPLVTSIALGCHTGANNAHDWATWDSNDESRTHIIEVAKFVLP